MYLHKVFSKPRDLPQLKANYQSKGWVAEMAPWFWYFMWWVLVPSLLWFTIEPLCWWPALLREFQSSTKKSGMSQSNPNCNLNVYDRFLSHPVVPPFMHKLVSYVACCIGLQTFRLRDPAPQSAAALTWRGGLPRLRFSFTVCWGTAGR